MASPARKGTSGGGERISMAVLRNSDSVTGIRFVPLHPPNAPRAFGSAFACFTPMSSLLTSFCGRLRPCRRALFRKPRLGEEFARLLGNYRQDLGDGDASDRDSYASAPESGGLGMHLRRHGKLDGIQ